MDNVPAYLQKYMIQNSAMTEAMSSVSTSVPRISLKGKKFQFINGDDESKKTSEIDVVIIGVTPEGPGMIKTYYAEGYDPSNTTPPDCSSSDGIRPDSWVTEPVSDLCKSCPMNQFGSAKSASGKKAKACKDSKRLWVIKPDDVIGTIYALNVPVTSLKHMSEYGKAVGKAGFPLAAIITHITMDEDSEFPMIHFSHKGFLPEKDGVRALERSMDKEWDNSADSVPQLPNKSEKQITEKPSNKVIEEKSEGASNSDIDSIIDEWES